MIQYLPVSYSASNPTLRSLCAFYMVNVLVHNLEIFGDKTPPGPLGRLQCPQTLYMNYGI